MYLYLFKTAILSAGHSRPVEEVCLGSFEVLENKFTNFFQSYKFSKDGLIYDPVVNLKLNVGARSEFCFHSKTTKEWTVFLQCFKEPSNFASSTIHDGYIYTICRVSEEDHFRLSKRWYNVRYTLLPRKDSYTTLSIKRYGREVFSKQVPFSPDCLKPHLSDIKTHTDGMKIQHCVLDFFSQPLSPGLKKFEEDSIQVNLITVDKNVGRKIS